MIINTWVSTTNIGEFSFVACDARCLGGVCCLSEIEEERETTAGVAPLSAFWYRYSNLIPRVPDHTEKLGIGPGNEAIDIL